MSGVDGVEAPFCGSGLMEGCKRLRLLPVSNFSRSHSASLLPTVRVPPPLLHFNLMLKVVVCRSIECVECTRLVLQLQLRLGGGAELDMQQRADSTSRPER